MEADGPSLGNETKAQNFKTSRLPTALCGDENTPFINTPLGIAIQNMLLLRKREWKGGGKDRRGAEKKEAKRRWKERGEGGGVKTSR